MPRDFLPSENGELLTWATSFSDKISASPTDFGLVAGQATAFASLLSTYSSAYAVSEDPATRTRVTISLRNEAKVPLKAMARDLARIINAFPTITNAQRLELGLNPRSGTISPINPPTEPPVLEVTGATGRILHVRLHAMDSSRRGKPEGVAGATLMSYVGNSPSADLSAWKFEGSTTRTSFDVEFPPTIPAGSQVFLAAFWFLSLIHI